MTNQEPQWWTGVCMALRILVIIFWLAVFIGGLYSSYLLVVNPCA